MDPHAVSISPQPGGYGPFRSSPKRSTNRKLSRSTTLTALLFPAVICKAVLPLTLTGTLGFASFMFDATQCSLGLNSHLEVVAVSILAGLCRLATSALLDPAQRCGRGVVASVPRKIAA